VWLGQDTASASASRSVRTVGVSSVPSHQDEQIAHAGVDEVLAEGS